MNEITEKGTKVSPRYYKGMITGIGITLQAEYSGVTFEVEASYEIPPERQVYAEEFTTDRMAEEVRNAHNETGARMMLYKKIWEYQEANEP